MFVRSSRLAHMEEGQLVAIQVAEVTAVETGDALARCAFVSGAEADSFGMQLVDIFPRASR